MKKNKPKNRSTTVLGERNLQIRIKIANSFNLSEEIFLKKYFCDRDTLFMVCLPSFKKIVRDKTDIKFISLYLSNLKKFTNLLKSINDDINNSNNTNNNAKQIKNEKDNYLKLLRNVSENIIYEKYASKRIIMRYGDLGDKFYMILHGQVSIIIPIRVNVQLTFNEYNRYIARLIFFQEYELAKITLRENKHIYNIDLPEIKFIMRYINMQNINESFEKEEKVNKKKNNFFYLAKSIKSSKNVRGQKFGNKSSKFLLEEITEGKNNIKEKKNIDKEKMLESENIIKFQKFMAKYLTKEEYSLYEEMNLKKLEDEEEDIPITPQAYISRLKNFKIIKEEKKKLIRKKSSTTLNSISPSRKSSKKLAFFSPEKEKNKEESENYESLKANHNKYTVSIYEYQEVNQLETGETFGDIALGKTISKRTATIISLMDSYFGCLNRDIYNSIKSTNDKNKKNKVNYLSHTKVFKCINSKTIETKYLNFFAFKQALMDEYIIKNGQISNNLILIKSGTFEISITGKLDDFFNLMNYYSENFYDLGDKSYEISDTILRKINKLNDNRNKIEKLFGENKNNENEHKLFLINSCSIFGLKETEKKEENNNFTSFFNIKCISSEGEYALLDKRIFYKQIYGPDFQVKEETKLYIKEFVEKAINRLIHLLYSKIWNILSRNNMNIFKNIKNIPFDKKEKKTKNNLIQEIQLDFYYMKKYNLTDIEWIIESILNKYHEDAFDNTNISAKLFNYFKRKRITSVQEKNLIKFEEEKYDPIKFISLLNKRKNKGKKHFTRLLNFKRCNSLINSTKKVFNEKKSNVLNYEINSNTTEKRCLSPTNRPIKIVYKLDKTLSNLEEDKKSYLSPINRKPNSKNFSFTKDNNYYNNYNNLSRNLSSGLLRGKSIDSFIFDVSVTCNYSNFNNACISKLNYNINKNNSMKDFESLNINKLKSTNYVENEMNKIFGGDEKYKSIYNRCFSAKNKNNSKICIFDSNRFSKEIYTEQRKNYVLKNTRFIFTRNKNFVQYKRRKKKVNKNV